MVKVRSGVPRPNGQGGTVSEATDTIASVCDSAADISTSVTLITAKSPPSILEDTLGIAGSALDFLKFPLTCLAYLARDISGQNQKQDIKPVPPWREKRGLATFALSSAVLALGIVALAIPGVNVAIGLAIASVTLARALWGLGTTWYALRKSNPTEETRKKLSSTNHYLDIAEQSIGAGIAVLSLAGAAVTLFNPITGPIIGAVALGVGIVFGLYKLASWIINKSVSPQKTSPADEVSVTNIDDSTQKIQHALKPANEPSKTPERPLPPPQKHVPCKLEIAKDKDKSESESTAFRL